MGQIALAGMSRPVVVFGDGDVSEIRAISTSGAFNFGSTTNYVTFEFRSLRIRAYAAGPCITVVCAPAATTHTRHMLRMEHVTIGWGNTYFTRGLVMSYASNALITSCLFEGGENNANGNRAIEIAQISVNTIIANTNLNFWEYGIHCAVYQEGLALTNVFMVYVKYGLYQYVVSSAMRSTLFALTNCHIDARGGGSYALWCNNLDGLQVSNGYFIAEAGCFRLTQVFQSTITGNYFFMPGPYGITLENSSPSQADQYGNQIGCLAVTIVGNTFHGPGYGVLLDTMCMNCTVQHNTRATRSAASPYRPDMTNLSLNTSDSTGGTRGNVVQA